MIVTIGGAKRKGKLRDRMAAPMSDLSPRRTVHNDGAYPISQCARLRSFSASIFLVTD
jgi:hypothetical protein